MAAPIVHNYSATQRRDTNSLFGYERVLISPRLFGDYAASRIVATLERALKPLLEPAVETPPEPTPEPATSSSDNVP